MLKFNILMTDFGELNFIRQLHSALQHHQSIRVFCLRLKNKKIQTVDGNKTSAAGLMFFVIRFIDLLSGSPSHFHSIYFGF